MSNLFHCENTVDIAMNALTLSALVRFSLNGGSGAGGGSQISQNSSWHLVVTKDSILGCTKQCNDPFNASYNDPFRGILGPVLRDLPSSANLFFSSDRR